MASVFQLEKNVLFGFGVGFAGVLMLLSLFIVKGVVDLSSPSRKRSLKKTKAGKYIEIDDEMLTRFSKAIQCQTVSYSISENDEPWNKDELIKLHQHIRISFPHVHSSPLVKCEMINKYSLLYTVKGSDSNLKPYLLISHLDVVPVKDQKWDVPQFGGIVKDGFIWGRGTLDVKNGVMGSLEALEVLLKSGHIPNRGFFLSFGHDEEVFGHHGAAHIARELVSRGVSLEFVQDEGLMILNDVLPGIKTPAALVAVAEKGALSVNLKVESTVGHASMPPKESSIGILANAVARIERNAMPSAFGHGPEVELFSGLSPVLPFLLRVIMANMWLFKPLVSWILSRKASTNALVRSTIAVTKIHGGTKDNVVPASATAHLNIRIHPGDTAEKIIDHLRSCIHDDRVQIEIIETYPQSPIASSDSDSFGYNTVVSSILDVFPDVTVVPGLLVAGTDSKHFQKLTSEIYRFMPSQLNMADVSFIHGSNERISVKNYEQTINFYYRLMINADQATL